MGANQSSHEKVIAETVKVKFQHHITSRGHNSLLRSSFGEQEQSMENL
jgi:hypothetical protein